MTLVQCRPFAVSFHVGSLSNYGAAHRLCLGGHHPLCKALLSHRLAMAENKP